MAEHLALAPTGTIDEAVSDLDLRDEASFLAVDRAEYDIEDAPLFWRRMAAEHPGTIHGSFLASHPTSAERAAGLRATIEEINAKRAEGVELIPERRDEAR